MITATTVESFKVVKRQEFVINRISAVVGEHVIAFMKELAKKMAPSYLLIPNP